MSKRSLLLTELVEFQDHQALSFEYHGDMLKSIRADLAFFVLSASLFVAQPAMPKTSDCDASKESVSEKGNVEVKTSTGARKRISAGSERRLTRMDGLKAWSSMNSANSKCLVISGKKYPKNSVGDFVRTQSKYMNGVEFQPNRRFKYLGDTMSAPSAKTRETSKPWSVLELLDKPKYK